MSRLINISHLLRHTDRNTAKLMIGYIERYIPITMLIVPMKMRTKDNIEYINDKKTRHFDLDECREFLLNVSINRKNGKAPGSIATAEKWKRVLSSVNKDYKEFDSNIPETSDIWEAKGFVSSTTYKYSYSRESTIANRKNRQRKFIEKWNKEFFNDK